MTEQTGARAALTEADRRIVQTRGADAGRRWIYVMWAVVLAVGLPAFDLLPPLGAAIAFSSLVVVAGGLTPVLAARTPVVRRGGGRRHLVVMAVWTVWYLMVLMFGILVLAPVVPWAMSVTGLLAAAPFVVAALFEGRR